MPTISILIRTHGRPQLLRQALQTIANQTVTGGLEVVVVEDGEPTAQAVIDDFADLPLHYHATGQPVGRSAAGNLALQLAKGDYCCFLDEDDWLLASYLETWQRLCIEHPGHRLFFAASMQLAGSYGADGVSWHTRRAIPMPVKDADWLTVALGNPVPIQAVLFHRSLYCQLGGFDERLEAYEDWNLWQRYAAVEHPLCTERCTSVFKVPADPVAFARRELRMKQQLSLCIAMGRQYPVATSMGQLAHHTHAAATAMQHYEPWVHAAEYDRTARQIAASRLWRATAPLRSMGHGLMQMGAALCGLQPPPLPRPPEWAETIEEEIAFIRYARSSPSWKVTEPLRRLGEWYKIRKKRF